VKTTTIVCPFANFGSPGAAQGAELLADALRELLDDVKKEKRPTRSQAFRGHVRIEEMKFDAMESMAGWQKSARSLARSVFERGEFLIWIGGNHLSVLPVYEELAVRDVRVVQFDAHLDLYNLDDCKTELNHGNFLRHAERLPSIVNVGHRDLFLQSRAIGGFYEAAHPAVELARAPDEARTALREWTADAEVFLDIDCDVLDPTFFPATTHAMPFGLIPETLLQLIDSVWSERLCGVALSEFDPARDREDRSLQTLVWLLEWILLKKYE
jgi:agmatinase